MRKFTVLNKHRILILFLLLLQIGFARCYIPISDWFTPEPIYTDDYILHYADALYKGRYLDEYKMLFGYNPYVRAGTACNILFSVDNYGWSLFVYFLSFLSTGFAFKLYLLLTLLGIPLVIYKSARNFTLSKQESVICSVLGTLFLHVSICVDLLYWGTVSYILSCYLSVLIISFFYRFLEHRRVYDVIFFTLLFTIGVWCHLLTVLHVMVPLVVTYLFCFRKISMRQHILVISSAGLVFLLNSVWFFPYITFLPDFIGSGSRPPFFLAASLREPINTYFFFNSAFNQYMNIPFPKSGFVDLLLMGAGILGIAKWRREVGRLRYVMFAFSVGILFLLAYYGHLLHFTARLTPLRFVVYMNIFLCVPAAAGIMKLYDMFLRDKTLKVKTIFLVIIFYLLGTLLATPYIHLFKNKDFRLLMDMPEPVETLTQWIKENTDSYGRILIENSGFESSHQFFGTHLPYFFPFLTNREYIGNYSVYATSPDVFSSFGSGVLFQKPIGGYSLDEVWSYMHLYNIKWIIVWSNASRGFFGSFPDHFVLRNRVEKFSIFEVKREPTFFIKGKGNVNATLNTIELADLEPEDGKVVIAYHWMKYLRTRPEASLKQTFLLDDPVGFITLHNPPKRVVISTGYKDIFLDFFKLQWIRTFQDNKA